ncbi:MAG: AAA family ATPase [Chlorobium sp.]
MKILSLRFNNLNSLSGEWHIDFTAPEYALDGIFAITGPTGSGKSTILDAVALALYGQTPRLDKINKSGNEIMSRQSGECFSEVLFETASGRYRCHWSQRRSHKQPGGELQPQKHEIADGETGKIIESKLQNTLAAVVKLTGMDFEQFTRSMLLAQGGFAAFLQAPADERAPVLEQITGTEIYSRISMGVHERNRMEQQILMALREECSSIRLLDEEELAQAGAELQAKEREEAAIISRENDAGAALRWLHQMSTMKTELEGMEGDFIQLGSYEERFLPDRQRMEPARIAATFEPAYTTLIHIQETQKREMQEKSALEGKLEAATTALGVCAEAFSEAEQQQQGLNEQEKLLSGVLREVRALDVQFSAKQEQCREQEEATMRLCEQISASEKLIGKLELEMQQKRKTVEESELYLAAHAIDQHLLASLSGIEAAVQHYEAAQKGEAEAAKALEARQRELGVAQTLLVEVQPQTAQYRLTLDASRLLRQNLTERLASLLAGADIGQLRREVEGLHERARALDTLAARVATAKEIEVRIGVSERALEACATLQSHLAGEIESVGLLQQREVQLVESLEREAELLVKILSLDQERKLLQDGSPCPLCGSPHHPWAAESPETSGNDDALRLAKVSLQKSSTRLNALRVDAAKALSDREHHERQTGDQQQSLAVERTLLGTLAEQLDIDGEPSPEEAVALLSLARRKASERAALLAAAEQLEQQQKLAEAEEQQHAQQLAEAIQQENAALYARTTAEAEVERGVESLRKSGERRGEIQESLDREVSKYALPSTKEISCRELLLTLHDRCTLWKEAFDTSAAALQQLTILESTLQSRQDLLQTRVEEHGEKERLSQAAKASCTLLQQQRQQLFGAKNPDEEERTFRGKRRAVEEALDVARSSRDAASLQISELSARLGMIADSSGTRALEIAQKNSQLTGELASAGFESLESFLAARLERDTLEKLEEHSRRLAARRLELETLQSERKGKLREEEERALSQHSPQELQEELSQLSLLSALRTESAALKIRLYEHEKAAVLLREKTAALALRQIECTRWTTLHELIGSADGKKFRNFAQGLTFEIMIGHANRQLVTMSDRYLLVRSANQPLGLDVIDNYQAGEVRSTRNLSGGESFIVSLALALGLSQMSSRNVRVDSLFLDEGFGTLDEDALDTALQTLAALQQKGKIIGIISHVPAIKERISTQIRVHPGSGGRSRLSGPAVRG